MDNVLHVPGLESSPPNSCEVSSLVCCLESHSNTFSCFWCWCHY